MKKFWYAFLRLIGLPPLDLILYVPKTFSLEFNRAFMEMEVRRDIKNWLNRKVGVRNWKCDFEDCVCDENKADRVAFRFRRERDIILFKNSWHDND